MKRNTTLQPEALTLVQRIFARLNDPSPARYTAAINLRTFGRVALDKTDEPAKSDIRKNVQSPAAMRLHGVESKTAA